MLVALKPIDGDHAYELPPIATVPIAPLVVVQFKFNADPASAVGGVVFTLTVTLEVAVQPLLPVTVTVYVVVAVGLAVGCAMFIALNPVDGDHAYELPPIATVPIVPLVVVQFKINVEPALAVGAVVFTFTVTVEVAVHPFEPVTVTV
jgi:hypothetical protein